MAVRKLLKFNQKRLIIKNVPGRYISKEEVEQMHLKLKYILMAKGVKQYELAEIWGCSVVTVSNKLTGKSPIEIVELQKVIERYKFTTSEILDVLMAH